MICMVGAIAMRWMIMCVIVPIAEICAESADDTRLTLPRNGR